MWVGTDGGGLNRIQGSNVTVFTAKDGLSSNTVWAVHPGRNGTIWIGTDGGGLNRFKNGMIQSVNAELGLQGEFVSAILETSNGDMWVGTRDGFGVNRIRDGHVRNFSTKDGLADNVVWDVKQDEDGAIWIGTSAGLSRIRGDSVSSYGVRDGLFHDQIYSILTEDGRLWMGTDRGITSVRREDLDRFDRGHLASIPCETYGASEGMQSIECSGGSPSAWEDEQGRLWFATVAGIVMIDPVNIDRNIIPPEADISSIIIDNNIFKSSEEIAAPPGRRNIEIRYAGLSFVAPEKNTFKFRLRGYSDDWVMAGTRTSAFFTHLPPGDYTFELLASNNSGVWSQVSESVSFSLLPYFYETWYFTVLMIVVAVVSVGAVFRWRLAQGVRREEELKRRVEEALSDVKTLKGLLPICASCKKIRDDKGYWNQIESYVKAHTEAEFTHGLCPDCVEKFLQGIPKVQRPGERPGRAL